MSVVLARSRNVPSEEYSIDFYAYRSGLGGATMDDDFVSRREMDAIVGRLDTDTKRLQDEDHHINERIEKLEGTVSKIEGLAMAIEKMTVSIKTMATELKSQNERLEQIESKPGNRWEALVGDIIKLIVAAAVGFALAKAGLQ